MHIPFRTINRVALFIEKVSTSVPIVKPISDSSCLFNIDTVSTRYTPRHHPYAGSLLLERKVCLFVFWDQRNGSHSLGWLPSWMSPCWFSIGKSIKLSPTLSCLYSQKCPDNYLPFKKNYNLIVLWAILFKYFQATRAVWISDILPCWKKKKEEEKRISLKNFMWLYAISLDVFNKVNSNCEANLKTPCCLPESRCDLIISFHWIMPLFQPNWKLASISLFSLSLMIAFGGDHNCELRKEAVHRALIEKTEESWRQWRKLTSVR